MDSPAAEAQSTTPVLLDRVIAPFGNYIVTSFKDPYVVKNREQAGGVLDFSGEHVHRLPPTPENLEARVLDFLKLHPMLEIEKAGKITGFAHLTMPPRSVGYLLGDECVEELAGQYWRQEVEFVKEIRRESGGRVDIDDALSPQQYAAILKEVLPMHIWNELISESSLNHLLPGNDMPTYDVIFDKHGRALAIIDSGMLGNCGLGTSNVIIYEILGVTPKRLAPNRVFEVETLQLRSVSSTTMQPLPPSSHSPEEMSRLRQNGMVINYSGWPAYVDIKPGTPFNKFLQLKHGKQESRE